MSKSRLGRRCPVSDDARADILVKSIFLGHVGSIWPIEGAPELLLLGDGEACASAGATSVFVCRLGDGLDLA